MTPERLPRLDDPALRAALRRVFGGETAPPELRRRIERLLAEAQADGHVTPVEDVIRVTPSFWRSRAGVGMAAAAAVVLGVSMAAFQMSRPNSAPGVAQGPAALPAELGDQLVRRHDVCVRYAPHDHHHFESAPKDDFKAIAQGMSAELKHPVIATAMGHDWDFRGAALCPVGRTKSAHLMYARGDAFVSVFSLPASAVGESAAHPDRDAAVNGHPLAGFVESGAFYCVVGSTGGKTPMDLQQVRAIRDQLRSDVSAMRELEPVRFATAFEHP